MNELIYNTPTEAIFYRHFMYIFMKKKVVKINTVSSYSRLRLYCSFSGCTVRRLFSISSPSFLQNPVIFLRLFAFPVQVHSSVRLTGLTSSTLSVWISPLRYRRWTKASVESEHRMNTRSYGRLSTVTWTVAHDLTFQNNCPYICWQRTDGIYWWSWWARCLWQETNI